MEKITLKQGEVIEINGAIIGLDIVSQLLDLQLGMFYPDATPRDTNSGLYDYMGSYRKLIMFLAGNADSLTDKEKLCSWMQGITAMMKSWNSFRVPGTKEIEFD